MKSKRKWPLVAALLSASIGRAFPQEAPAAAAAEAPEAPPLATKITAVTLYSDQALVLRTGALDLPAGRSRLEVSGLPAALKDESVRARMIGGGASLANLEVVTRNKTIFKKKEAEEAERKLKEIQTRHKGVSNQMAALAQEAALLKGFEVGRKPEGQREKPEPSPIDVVAWEAALQFIENALVENQKQTRQFAVELDGVEEELAVAQALMDKLSSHRVEASKSALLELEAQPAGRVEIEIAYLVPGPGWWPRYDIRASVETGKVELVSHALVRQETGEDWEGVELTFSAAEPARAADLPELVAWRIGELQAPVQAQQVVSSLSVKKAEPDSQARTFESDGIQSSEPEQFASKLSTQSFTPEQIRQVPSSSKAARTRGLLDNIAQLRATNSSARRNNEWDAVVEGNKRLANEILSLDKGYQAYFADDLMSCADNIARGERLLRSARLADGIVPPVQSSRGYDYKYRALRPETIPSDGAFNKVVIGVEEFPAEFTYEAAPEQLEVAFLTTKIKNQRRQPYLDGPASVFLGPDFVGDGRVPTTARGEELPVNLGADESIRVRRHSETKRETTGFFTSYHKYRTSIEVVVKNQKSRRVRLALLDRLPFSEDKNLKIVSEAFQPPSSLEERNGLLRWNLALEPGVEGKVSFAYTVELPAKMRVVSTADETVRLRK